MGNLLVLVKFLVSMAVVGGMILLFRRMGMEFVYGILFATVIYQVAHRLKYGVWMDVI